MENEITSIYLILHHLECSLAKCIASLLKKHLMVNVLRTPENYNLVQRVVG